ncbi:hypothetical protein [Tateyamaria sp.]|uniref:hypothetical protein n=1 Tax=Tateyamaria sp. TaxID=1929288 RepID=UPI003B222705
MLAGRAESVVGAHCKGRNARSMGICLIGGHGSSERDAFQGQFHRRTGARARRPDRK